MIVEDFELVVERGLSDDELCDLIVRVVEHFGPLHISELKELLRRIGFSISDERLRRSVRRLVYEHRLVELAPRVIHIEVTPPETVVEVYRRARVKRITRSVTGMVLYHVSRLHGKYVVVPTNRSRR